MTAVNPFIYSDAAKKTFYFVSDLPNLGFIHLSKLSPDELKGLAQFFNLMATKHGAPLLSYKLYAIGFLALSVISGVVFAATVANNAPIIAIASGGVCILGLIGIIHSLSQHKFELIQQLHHTHWRNYTLDILDLKLNPIELPVQSV